MCNLNQLLLPALIVATACVSLGCNGNFFAGSKALPEAQDRPHVVLVIGEDHFYNATDCIWDLAKALQTHYGMRCTVLQATSRTCIPNMEILDDADLAMFYIRRRVLPKEAMQHVHDYLNAGKPLIAFRTSCVAFATLTQAFTVSGDTSAHTADKEAEEAQTGLGMAPWDTFDREVLGGYYQGYYLGETKVTVMPEMKNHPILNGITGPCQERETLYICLPLAHTSQVLLMGQAVDGEGDDPRYKVETDKEHVDQPLAWIHDYKGAKVFFTSMGSGLAAFNKSWFRRMVINATFWALDKPVPAVDEKAYIAALEQ